MGEMLSCIRELKVEVESLKRDRERVLRTLEIPLVYRLLMNADARKIEPAMEDVNSKRLEILLKSSRLSEEAKTF